MALSNLVNLGKKHHVVIILAAIVIMFFYYSALEPIPQTERFVNVPISTQAHHSEAMGQLSAYLPMSGQHQLVFYWDAAGSTPANLEVTVLYSAASVLSIQRGQITISHS
jgi:hypothetical protein